MYINLGAHQLLPTYVDVLVVWMWLVLNVKQHPAMTLLLFFFFSIQCQQTPPLLCKSLRIMPVEGFVKGVSSTVVRAGTQTSFSLDLCCKKL